MNTHDPSEQLQKLIQAARRAPDNRGTEIPAGFATRVAARAFASEESAFSALFERLSWRAFAFSCLLMAATIASSYGVSRVTGQATASTDDEGDLQDPVAEIIELAS